jgi:hypothetical protein
MRSISFVFRFQNRTDVSVLRVDICKSAIFWQSWLCINCGVEICDECMSALDEVRLLVARERLLLLNLFQLQFTLSEAICSNGAGSRHLQTDLRPLSRFQDTELEKAISEMGLMLTKQPQRFFFVVIIRSRLTGMLVHLVLKASTYSNDLQQVLLQNRCHLLCRKCPALNVAPSVFKIFERAGQMCLWSSLEWIPKFQAAMVPSISLRSTGTKE